MRYTRRRDTVIGSAPRAAAGFAFALLLSVLASSAHAQQERIGSWTYAVDRDGFTGTATHAILQHSRDQTGREMSVLLACKGRLKTIALSWQGYFGGNSNREVRLRYRINDEPPSSSALWMLGGRSMAMPWDDWSGRSKLFSDMNRGQRIMFEITDPLDGERRYATFSLNSLPQAMAKLPC
jgi:hypothetical protein